MYIGKFGQNPPSGSEDNALKRNKWMPTLSGSAPKQYIPPPSQLGEHNNISQCIHHAMGSKENLNQELCNELLQKQISLVCHLLCTSPSPKRGFQYQRISFNSLKFSGIYLTYHVFEIRIINIKQVI